MFYLYPFWLHYALFHVIILSSYGGKMEPYITVYYTICKFRFPLVYYSQQIVCCQS
jgi:hypothetical protein